MHELCLHKIGPNKSDQEIGPELQNAQIKKNILILSEYFKKSKVPTDSERTIVGLHFGFRLTKYVL
jgi:hypothetical protein